MNQYKAFTLIELLVVVTIIVILLALLTPALDKAIYHAELLECSAGRLKVIGNGITTYTMDYGRRYPTRGLPPGKDSLTASATTIYSPLIDLDMRPPIQDRFSLNKVLQCPFAGQIELEAEARAQRVPPESDVLLESSFVLFWGWQYDVQTPEPRTYAGMFKLGDRFAYDDVQGGADTLRFSVLAGDMDLAYPQAACTSHPDRDPAMLSLVMHDPGTFIGRFASGWWRGTANDRGFIEANYVMTDGSVEQYADVKPIFRPGAPAADHTDERMAVVPINYDNYNDRGINSDKYQIPRR